MFKKQTDNRVAVFFADGCEEIEGLTVVDLLFRAASLAIWFLFPIRIKLRLHMR